MPTDPSHPLVSVVMPVKDEAPFLSGAIDAIIEQDYPAELIELIIADGGSTDGSVEIVQRRAGADSRISLIGGPGVNCPAGMNLGIARARGDLVAKIDGHGYVNREFIRIAVEYLASHPNTGCVGGPVVPVATSEGAQANAIARFSIFGVGGGVYTLAQELQPADTVQCGVYRRAVLEEIGGFDPDLQFGEDEELNYRVRQRGWGIAFHPGMRFHYHMRPTLRGLFRQYVGYGAARVAVVRKHPDFLRMRHVAPAVLVTALAASLVGALVLPVVRPITAAVWGSYAAFLSFGALVLSARAHSPMPHRVAASLASLHLGYGLGMLQALLQRAVRRR